MLRFRPKKKKDKDTDDGTDADTANVDANATPSGPAGDGNPADTGDGTPSDPPADATGTPDASAGGPESASGSDGESCAPTPESTRVPEVKGPEAEEDPLLRPIAKDERDKAEAGQSVVHSSTGDFYVEDVRARIVDVLMTVFDPEIPVDIYQLGLIYSIDVHDDASVDIEMTLTSPACPVAGTLPPEVEDKVATVDGVDQARVEVVWDPPWNPGMMTESARLELGFF